MIGVRGVKKLINCCYVLSVALLVRDIIIEPKPRKARVAREYSVELSG